MAERDSWAVQASGPTGILDVEEVRVALGALWTPGSSGVVVKSGFRPGPGASPGLVSATGTPDANVHVAPFQLVLQTGRAGVGGPYIMTLDAIKDINILSTPAHATNPRDDLIVAQQSDTFYGDGVSTWTVRQVVGTPAGSPSDPAVSGSTDYVTLARVRVVANATTITGGNITDLRTSGHAKSLTGGLYAVAVGGWLPVASQAQRDALTGVYPGFAVWRTDTTPDRVEVYDGTGWLPLAPYGLLPVANQAARDAITGVYDGLAVWRQDNDWIDVYAGAAYQQVTPYRQVTVLGGLAATVTLSGIPSSLRNVRVTWHARNDAAAASSGMFMRVNGDAGANYHTELTETKNAAVSAFNDPSGTNSVQVGNIPAATAAAGVFGAGEVLFTGWDRGARLPLLSRSGYFDTAANSSHITTAGSYAGAAPYTSVSFTPTGGNFIAASEFMVEGWI